ncbi:uroporphyrinogen-III C-methyltransferase [Kushneria phosphatilytica]|uniref:uroporphyrinogen-III C-methyltransferase n=2 Tax=Kushneria phosphatilytica TaxID=657387 RepID=A0A5C1A438_9GAMM|nr:uroporphyrinogen-III C-methyltransferase [Kushneria phosphatilytica]
MMRLGHAATRALLPTRTPTPEIAASAQRAPAGRVALVGAGPGAADLLTVRALTRLQAADAVVYDRLVGQDILALLPTGCERYYVGKACGHHSVPQAEIGERLVALAREGKRVVRLKGGDPGVFGRMGEELAALSESGIETEIVPGITAASGAASALGLPLTDRAHAQSLRFVTARQAQAELDPDWRALARRDETLVFYMGLGRVAEICDGLIGAGLPANWPIMLIAHATLPTQQIRAGTLATLPARLAEAPMPSPCLIVVGSVVLLYRGGDDAGVEDADVEIEPRPAGAPLT